MNSSIENKKFNLAFFFGACALSIGLLGGAGFFGYMSLKTTASGTSANVNQICINQLRANALNPKVTTNLVEVKVANPADLELLAETASVVLATCVGYEIKEFCAGLECATPGVSFTLVEKVENK